MDEVRILLVIPKAKYDMLLDIFKTGQIGDYPAQWINLDFKMEISHVQGGGCLAVNLSLPGDPIFYQFTTSLSRHFELDKLLDKAIGGTSIYVDKSAREDLKKLGLIS